MATLSRSPAPPAPPGTPVVSDRPAPATVAAVVLPPADAAGVGQWLAVLLPQGVVAATLALRCWFDVPQDTVAVLVSVPVKVRGWCVLLCYACGLQCVHVVKLSADT